MKDTKPDFLGSFADLRVRTEADGSWRILTEEQYRHRTAPRLETVLLARGTSFQPGATQHLASLQPLSEIVEAQELNVLRALRARSVSTRKTPQPVWANFVGETQLAPDDELPARLYEVQQAGSRSDSLWLVRSPPVLLHRLALMRGFFSARHGHDAWDQRTRSQGFPACQALMMNSNAGFMLYLLPPLLYGSPWTCGSAANRTNGGVVRLLANPEPGRSVDWGSPLDSAGAGRLYEGPGVPAQPREPAESQDDREEFFCWWAEHVAELLQVLSDFSSYRDGVVGDYDPARHLGTVLTAERLFVSAVESMRLRTVAELVRKLLLFDVLDLLDGQGMGDHEENLHHTRQLQAWEELEATLPKGVQHCVSPLITGAFEALRSVEDTIWASSRRIGDDLAVDRKKGNGQDLVTMDRARGEYIRILRDTHHGYGKLMANKRDLSYLAAFTGELSNALPDLVWWYLIRLVSRPQELLRYSGGVPPRTGAGS